MILDKEGKNLFVNADGVMSKINVDNHDKKSISFKAEMVIKPWEERAAMFEHAWRQAREKFYVSDLQKTDWNYYKKTYLKFLPHINNNYDFAELLSEMLGELNASHTGGRYNARHKNADETAALGVFYDEQYIGNGIKIIEMMNKGPFDNSTSLVKEGCIIEKIDGDEIFENTNISEKLNRKVGKNILVSVFDPSIKKRWDEVVKPISLADQNELLYKRWIKLMQKETERLSNGTLGYVHVRSMNDESFRIVYEQALGMYPNCKGLIVDTRYNGGGWLHDDLCTFLSGKDYVTFVPRERKIGHDPAKKWTAKSCVLMSEGNYSDAHMFPYAYKALNIGKLIGMPVAGTGTAVWWETMWDGTIVFGIPQVGVVGMDGKYLENQQLEPDIKVMNDYKEINAKRDQQLEAAIKELLK
jgi:C-terminal processing protease CtpA/Prc